MTNHKLFLPVARIVGVLYFIYKMVFSDPTWSIFDLYKLNTTSAATLLAGIIFYTLFSAFLLGLLWYQLRQAKYEYQGEGLRKDLLRLFSVLWSLVFYPLALWSVLKINLVAAQISLIEYLIEFYTLATLIGSTAGLVALIKDIKIIIALRRR